MDNALHCTLDSTRFLIPYLSFRRHYGMTRLYPNLEQLLDTPDITGRCSPDQSWFGNHPNRDAGENWQVIFSYHLNAVSSFRFWTEYKSVICSARASPWAPAWWATIWDEIVKYMRWHKFANINLKISFFLHYKYMHVHMEKDRSKHKQ